MLPMSENPNLRHPDLSLAWRNSYTKRAKKPLRLRGGFFAFIWAIRERVRAVWGSRNFRSKIQIWSIWHELVMNLGNL